MRSNRPLTCQCSHQLSMHLFEIPYPSSVRAGGGSNLPPCNLPEVQPLFSLFQPYSLGHLEKGLSDIFADLLSFQEIAE